MLLPSCASSGAGVSRILERPADFPEGVVYTPIELRVIILGGLIGGIYFIYKEGKNDKR